MRMVGSKPFFALACTVGVLGFLALSPEPLTAAAPLAQPPAPVRLSGLQSAARLVQDRNGITHVKAGTLHDLFFLQGWVHARDRLFQMDVSRRQASGTLAELLGKAALQGDVQARAIGLRRAAERTWAAAPPDLRATLTAYADGVNAYVDDHPLPAEYGVLHLTSFQPWTPVDTLTVGKAIAFELSFDLDIGPTLQLQAYIRAFGLERGVALFTRDVMRSQPFSNAATVPDASGTQSAALLPSRRISADLRQISQAAPLARAYLTKIAGDPLFRHALDRDTSTQGSNEWAVAGNLTVTGHPLLANDPHLALSEPSTFYPIGLEAPGMDVEGEGFAGVPGVIIGHNRWISWGATVNPMDVTDTYLEKVVADPTSPSGLSTVFKGTPEHVIPIPETFRYNDDGQLATASAADGVPPATLIVPRRNNGPIVQLTPPAASSPGSALSVQYTGFSPTFELEAFLRWDQARNLSQFEQGLPFFAVGSQNWSYADTGGNIAYFTSAEMPVREDLQAGTVNGLPPWFIRNGQGGNEWLPVQHPQPGQAIPYEIYPAAEMPHIINPPAGWFVSANNDPAGTNLDNDPLNQVRPGGGLYYLNYGYDGFRAGRIEQMLRQRLVGGHRVSISDMKAMQADAELLDAEYFVPHITQAFADAKTSATPQLAALATDPAVAEAVSRLGAWDFTTPTGLAAGYDAGRTPGTPPSQAEIADSVAATIYAAWRSEAVGKIVDDHLGALPKPGDQQALTAMQHLFDAFPEAQGVGASGIDFFGVPGVSDPAAARDYLVLSSVRDALARLASPPFGAAFHQSTNQDDYRWGRLHRLVLAHLLGGDFSVPPAFGQFPAPLPGLAGIPVDGGFETVDAASHHVRATGADGFTFGSGPARRLVASLAPGQITAASALPGGTSEDPTSPFYVNLLRPYLTDDYYPALLVNAIPPGSIASQLLLVPGA
jgi:penicillin G amidase